MPAPPRLHWSALSPEATLPKSGFPVCPNCESASGIFQAAVIQLDRLLRRCQGIYEFCQEGDCVLRVAKKRAKKHIELPDGSEVNLHDEILEIHWWNEHVAQLIADKPALARAKLLTSLVEHSFEQLAKYLAAAPEAQRARFIHGDAVLPMRNRRNHLDVRARQFGLWVVHPDAGYFDRMHDFLETYLVRALLWAFHRRNAGLRSHTLRRVDLWTTREEFLARYLRPLAPSLEARAAAENLRSPLAN